MAGEWVIDVSNDDPGGTAAVLSMVISAEQCEGALADVEESVPLAELPFLLSEDGMPFVTRTAISLPMPLSNFGMTTLSPN